MKDNRINPCKCGTDKTPYIDSDDMVPCWAVECFACKQFVHGPSWTYEEAVKEWNKANPVKIKKHKQQ